MCALLLNRIQRAQVVCLYTVFKFQSGASTTGLLNIYNQTMGNSNAGVHKNEPSFALPFCAKDRNGRDMFRMFVCGARGVSFNYEPCTKRLHVESASHDPDLDLIKQLLDSGWEVDDQELYDGCGKTALIEAAINENIDVMKILVEQYNATVDFTDNFNQTALMWAVVCEHEQCVKYLLEKGAKMNETNQDGFYPAHLVLEESDNSHTFELLHKAGAQLDVTDSDGETCVHYCARYDSKNTLAYLIDAGAKLDIKNHKGETARDIAVLLQHDEAVDMLDGTSHNHAKEAGNSGHTEVATDVPVTDNTEAAETDAELAGEADDAGAEGVGP